MPTDIQYERETTIVFNEAEPKAYVWSASPLFQRKMKKCGIESHKEAEGERGRTSCWYLVPKTWVKVKPPTFKKAPFSGSLEVDGPTPFTGSDSSL